jgi:hypothetical protein
MWIIISKQYNDTIYINTGIIATQSADTAFSKICIIHFDVNGKNTILIMVEKMSMEKIVPKNHGKCFITSQ